MSRDLFRRSGFGAKAERDRNFELALKHELRRAGTPAAEPGFPGVSVGGCVDAETLGAWAEGGMDAAQMAAIELHVSSCGRCQAIVGVAARSAPVIAQAANQGGFRFPRWALAPLAAAAAITIWMVVPQDTTQPPHAPAPVAEPPQDVPNTDAGTVARDSAASAPSREIAGVPETRPAAPRTEEFSEAKRERANIAQPALQHRAARTEERTTALGAAASAPPPPAAPLAETILQKSAKPTVSVLEIVSPDASRRWRIVNGAIERSDNGGTSWVTTRALSGRTITGGTAPSASICWLIGPAGMVMLAADGITFTEVPLPDPVDLTAITATDARVAIATTADGRRFRTDDSGRTWRQN